MRTITVAVLLSAMAACASNEWVLKDPPKTCAAMCEGWGMELAAIVGVGEQSREEKSQGATACVCQPRGATAMSDSELSAAGYAAIPPEVRAREAEAAAAQQRRNQQSSAQKR